MKRFLFLLGILILLGISKLSVNIESFGGGDYKSFSANITIAEETEVTSLYDPFKDLNVSAQSYLVFDFRDSNIISSRDPHLQWPLASISKLMTALLTEEQIPFYAIINLSVNAILEDGDNGFLVEESFYRNDLRDIMMIQSSNDAAYALAEYVGRDYFIKAMNERASSLGMRETYFLNSNGLDISKTISGAYGSARDLMVLLRYIMNNHPEILDTTRRNSLEVVSLEGVAHRFTNTNKIADSLPQLIGGKTGFTDIAGGNLVVVVDIGINHPVGIIVLGSSEEGRFNDVMNLYQATIEWYKNL